MLSKIEPRIILPEKHLVALRECMTNVANEYAMYTEGQTSKTEERKRILEWEKMSFLCEEVWASTSFTAVQLRRYAKVIGETSVCAWLSAEDTGEYEADWIIQLIKNLKEFAIYAKDVMPLQEEVDA